MTSVSDFWIEEGTYFPRSADCAPVTTAQDAVSHPHYHSTWLAYIQLTVYQDPQVLLCRPAPQPLCSQTTLLQGFISPQAQEFTFALTQFHRVAVGSLLQPAYVPLNSSPGLDLLTGTQIWYHLGNVTCNSFCVSPLLFSLTHGYWKSHPNHSLASSRTAWPYNRSHSKC